MKPAVRTVLSVLALGLALPAGGAQLAVNGDFEASFIDRVGEGWTWFATRAGAVAGEESVTVHGGSRAQRVASPPNFTVERYAGVYQVLDVAPGETYTFTAWCRMWDTTDPNPPRVPLMVVSLSGSTSWTSAQDVRVEIPGTFGKWAVESFSFEAPGPRISLWLVGWHKWPLGGFDGGFIFDDVRLDGPPADEPTKTPTLSPTVTPTPTVTPPALGPSLVRHGDFETGFVDGLAPGWQGWSGGGAARWRENPKLGPMGAGVCGPVNSLGEPCECHVSMEAMKAKFHLVIVGTGGYGSLIKQADPEVRLVGRRFNDFLLGNRLLNMTDAELAALGRSESEACYDSYVGGFDAQCWTDANEQNFNNDFHRAQYLKYCLAFVRRCTELGLRSCVFSLAVGNPTDQTAMRSDAVRQVLAEADYVAYHAYGPPGTDLMMTSAPESHAFQWRKYARWYKERGWRMPPMIYTEGTTYGGWHDRFTPAAIGNDMLGFAGEMAKDPWALAMTVFCMGDWSAGGAWNDWDVSPFFDDILHPVGDWNTAHPVDAHSGTRAQQFESDGDALRGGVVQAVTVPEAGFHRLDAHLRWEWFPDPALQGRPEVSIRLGYDPTGQTGDGSAATVVWSDDLVARLGMDTDIWYAAQWLVDLPAGEVSLWIGAAQAQPGQPVRVSVDDVALYASSEPVEPTPTETPRPRSPSAISLE